MTGSCNWERKLNITQHIHTHISTCIPFLRMFILKCQHQNILFITGSWECHTQGKKYSTNGKGFMKSRTCFNSEISSLFISLGLLMPSSNGFILGPEYGGPLKLVPSAANNALFGRVLDWIAEKASCLCYFYQVWQFSNKYMLTFRKINAMQRIEARDKLATV